MTAALEGGEWSAARPCRTLPPGKSRYPFYRRLGRPLCRSGRSKSRPKRDSIPDRPACSLVAILLKMVKLTCKWDLGHFLLCDQCNSAHNISDLTRYRQWTKHWWVVNSKVLDEELRWHNWIYCSCHVSVGKVANHGKPVRLSKFPPAENKPGTSRTQYRTHLCYDYLLTYFALLDASLKMAYNGRNM